MDFVKLEYKNKNDKKENCLNDLKNIIINSNASLEGNCFYKHNTLNVLPDLYSKQLNLFWCGKQAISHICEIGFNAGHSSLLMLLGRDNTPINFTIFDIDIHPYTQPCFEYIKSNFSFANFEFIKGDSTIAMPEWINNHNELIGKYDVIHVDGGHTEHCISNDMINADKLIKIDGIIIIDDTQSNVINKYVNLYISSGKYTELKLLQTHGYKHRVIQKIKK